MSSYALTVGRFFLFIILNFEEIWEVLLWIYLRDIIKYMSEKIYPEPVVGALIFNQEGKIFIMASPKWQGKYSLAGGHIEVGETNEKAVKREAKEEIFIIKWESQLNLTPTLP